MGLDDVICSSVRFQNLLGKYQYFISGSVIGKVAMAIIVWNRVRWSLIGLLNFCDKIFESSPYA